MNKSLFMMTCGLVLLCSVSCSTNKAGTSGSQPSIFDTEWALSSIKAKDTKEAVAFNKENPPTLRVNADKTANGFAGCNRFTGSATVEGKSIKLGRMGMTRMFCEQGMTVESAMANLFEVADNFEIKGGKLMLKHGSEVVAEFTAKK